MNKEYTRLEIRHLLQDAEYNTPPNDPNILALANHLGESVAHIAAACRVPHLNQ